MSAPYSLRQRPLMMTLVEKKLYVVITAEKALRLLKRLLSYIRRISKTIRPNLRVLKTETVIDPSFEDLINNFSVSQVAFENASTMFWRLRVTNEELKEHNRALQDENAHLKTLLRSENLTSLP